MDTPLRSFVDSLEEQEDGTYTHRFYPLGEGAAQKLMMSLYRELGNAYYALLLIEEEEGKRFEFEAEVPIIRNGRKVYEPLDGLTLRDLPEILDTLMVLQEESDRRERE